MIDYATYLRLKEQRRQEKQEEERTYVPRTEEQQSRAEMKQWLINRVDNLRVIGRPEAVTDSMMKCRDIYNDELHKTIDKYKIQQMRKISQ